MRTSLTISFLLCCYIFGIFGSQLEKVELSQREVFANGKYIVDWIADFDNDKIVFNITVETLGFIGFGLSASGNGMAGADIMIGGLYENGTEYIGDYFAEANGQPSLDQSQSQDWTLVSVSETGNHTNLIVSRLFNTCDNEFDVAINNDTLHLLWSFGDTDEIKYHSQNRGMSTINLLDYMPPVNVSEFEIWTVKHNMVMPTDDTTYWCSIHERPTFDQVNYVVGFSANLSSDWAIEHTHHFNLFECAAPEGEDPEDFFGKYIDHPGQSCYDWSGDFPLRNCRSLLYVWAIGGKTMMFPEHVGYPMSSNTKTYVMIEIHYNNPQKLIGREFEVAANVYYTPKARTYDAGLVLMGHGLAPTHIIPPKSVDYTTVGHCASSCLKQKIPEEGVNVFNVLMHSHLAGRKVRVRHFRDGKELPWISNDERYSFNYQQNRPLRNEVKVLPDDQLSYECVTDTSSKNEVTLAGLSTDHEMCEAFIWYYPKQDIIQCESMYGNFEKVFGLFGIYNWTYGADYFDPIVTDPEEHRGKFFSHVLNEFDWTEEFKVELQQELRYTNHESLCTGASDIEKIKEFVEYPAYDEPYSPPDSCQLKPKPSSNQEESESEI